MTKQISQISQFVRLNQAITGIYLRPSKFHMYYKTTVVQSTIQYNTILRYTRHSNDALSKSLYLSYGQSIINNVLTDDDIRLFYFSPVFSSNAKYSTMCIV